ncbi:MAG: hypothetical protein AB9856_00650 [Cellulosilyticaceae bacterium]
MDKHCKYIVLIIIIGILFYGYGRNGKYIYEWFPIASEENEQLLFNRYEQKLVTYDTHLKIVRSMNQEPDFLQSEFTTPSSLYTSGHNVHKHYKLLERGNNKVTILYSLNDDEAVFPLATNENYQLFTHTYYDKSGKEITQKRCITKFDSKQLTLTDYPYAQGLISKGVFFKGILYYTVFNENTKDYSMYALDCSNAINKPLLAENGLQSDELLVSNEGIWKSNKNLLYCNNKQVERAKLNYIYNNNLLQIDMNHKGTIYMEVTALTTFEKYLTFENIIDFKVDKSVLTVYGNGYISEKGLKNE